MQARFAAWRNEVSAWHPLPSGFRCLCYMVTEAGEALDAALRLERNGDVRTNDKAPDLGRELAQVVDMAYATAIRSGIDLDAEIEKWLQVVRERKP